MSRRPPAGERTRRPAKATAGAWRAALVVAAVLCAVSPWRPGGSSDGIAVFRTAASLAFEGTFVLPKAPPGATLDPFYFPPSPDGTGVVAVYAPFGAFVGAAVLLAASSVPSPAVAGLLADLLASLAPIVATSLAVVPLALLLRHGGARKDGGARLAAGLVLGTFLGPLGVSDFQEPWLVLFVAFALERASASRLLRGAAREAALALAGASVALALLAKPTAVALAPALALPAFLPRRGEPRARGLLALLLAAVPGLALSLALNDLRFGSPLALGYGSQTSHPLARTVSAGWTALRLTILPNRGLLWYAPVLVLAPLAVLRLRASGRGVVAASAALGFAAFFGANVAWFAWESGFGWGPRLLAPAVACAAPLLAARGRRLGLALALSLAGGVANLPAYLLESGRLYRVTAAVRGVTPLGPVVPIHRSRSGTGPLEPLQQVHYVPSLSPVFVGPRILGSLLRGEGREAGGASGRTHDAAVVRLLLGQAAVPGSATGRLLLTEAWVTAGSDPERAERMARRALALGGVAPP